MNKFSEKLSNGKIFNRTLIPCTLLIGYHLIPRYSESFAAPPPISQFGGRPKKSSSPRTLCQVSANAQYSPLRRRGWCKAADCSVVVPRWRRPAELRSDRVHSDAAIRAPALRSRRDSTAEPPRNSRRHHQRRPLRCRSTHNIRQTNKHNVSVLQLWKTHFKKLTIAKSFCCRWLLLTLCGSVV